MKFMIMNYKPYEYELLQIKLNKLGQQGYITQELSFITIFNKVDYPVYYHIDFHKTIGSTKIERQKDKDAFARKYQQKGYQPIYAKHHMFVFVSKKQKDLPFSWEDKKDIATGSFKILSFIGFFISLVALTLFSQYLYNASFDKFTSYGITLAYIGILLLFITSIFRNYFSFHQMSTMHHQLKNGIPHFSLKTLKSMRIVYFILSLLTIILIFGGLIEDVFNQKSFHQQEHQVIQLSDFQIDKETSFSSQSYSSFTIPHTYISLEEAKDGNEALYIKEFEFPSPEKAKQKFTEIKDLPSLYAGNHAVIDGSLLYGYYDDEIVSLTLLHNQSVTIIIPSFPLTEKNIQIISQFYA